MPNKRPTDEELENEIKKHTFLHDKMAVMRCEMDRARKYEKIWEKAVKQWQILFDRHFSEWRFIEERYVCLMSENNKLNREITALSGGDNND